MSQPFHILVVDDDPQIGELIKDYLDQHGFRVSTALNGREMERMMSRTQVDLIVLDLMLPGEDGLTLCRRLRETTDVLIIMLSAMGEEPDRVVGLEVGADDYMTKPFGPRELLARIKSLIRRSEGPIADSRKSRHIASLPNILFESWALDRNQRRLIDPDGITVPLSSGEYRLLLPFLENPRRTLNRDQLLDITSGREAGPFDRTIDVQVARLRKKIEKDPKKPKLIVTMRGDGYQFDANVRIDTGEA
jgi:two-component system, OmpR family, response regulator